MSKVLSQEEVDALLSGISGGEVETETDRPPATAAMKVHDFTNQDRTVKGKMPVLDLIGERCARSMRTSLSSSLRRPVGVKVVGQIEKEPVNPKDRQLGKSGKNSQLAVFEVYIFYVIGVVKIAAGN